MAQPPGIVTFEIFFSDALFYDVMDPERIRALIPNLRGTVAGRKDHLGV